MLYVGIDVAKDKHDCAIMDELGREPVPPFTVSNNRKGFEWLVNTISLALAQQGEDVSGVRIGLEATGHYSHNLLGFLLDEGFTVYLLNPLHTNLFRKSLTLRKTKTDKVDARTIATMLKWEEHLKPYSRKAYQNQELKSLTRYRFDKVRERAQLKQSISRLVTILFPELEKVVPSLHMASVYALLSRYPSAAEVACCEVELLAELLEEHSRGRYGREKAEEIHKAAEESIGSHMPAKSMELRHTIGLTKELDGEIEEIEEAIRAIMDEIRSPILTIPGIGYRMGAMIIAEVGDFSLFDSADKLLAYAGISPSTYQSGKSESLYAHMEKRGSRYLRYALMNGAKYVCQWDEDFHAYLEKKLAEGKPYGVAITHAAKRLVRLMYAMERDGREYER